MDRQRQDKGDSMSSLESITDEQALPDGGWWTAEYDDLDRFRNTLRRPIASMRFHLSRHAMRGLRLLRERSFGTVS
jgi:hypothetical protein